MKFDDTIEIINMQTRIVCARGSRNIWNLKQAITSLFSVLFSLLAPGIFISLVIIDSFIHVLLKMSKLMFQFWKCCLSRVTLHVQCNTTIPALYYSNLVVNVGLLSARVLECLVCIWWFVIDERFLRDKYSLARVESHCV